MKKARKFRSYAEYEAWTARFSECCEYQNIPTMIDDGWKVAMDMFVECKYPLTAIRRFKKIFTAAAAPEETRKEISAWCECIRECYLGGCSSNTLTYGMSREEIKECTKTGTYSWGVEEVDDGEWYIYLNLSGVYAGREGREKA